MHSYLGLVIYWILSVEAKNPAGHPHITIISVNGEDYISLTDLARHKSDEPNAVIANWMRNRNTIEYLGIWEQLYNPNFKPTEFEGFRIQAGLNAAPTEQT